MATTTTHPVIKAAKGGGFLLEESRPADVFTPEDFSDEHRQIARTTAEFTANEAAALDDCIGEVYAMESCILRAGKLRDARGDAAVAQAIAMTRYYAEKAIGTVEAAARKVVARVAEGDMLRTQMAIVRRLAKHEPADTIGIGRTIARHMISAGRYTL